MHASVDITTAVYLPTDLSSCEIHFSASSAISCNISEIDISVTCGNFNFFCDYLNPLHSLKHSFHDLLNTLYDLLGCSLAMIQSHSYMDSYFINDG